MVMLLTDGKHGGHAAATPDGRLWGPFGSAGAAKEWERIFSTGFARLATAAEVWEGVVPEGHAAWLVSEFAVEFGLHPFTEVHDWFMQHDNGHPVAELLSGPRRLNPREAVYVGTAERESRPARRLPDPDPCPETFDLRGEPSCRLSSRSRGEIVVANDGGAWMVGWRPDGRVTRRLRGLSLHGIEACARMAARVLADEWEPPARRGSSVPRDVQRSLVYRWEAGLATESEKFGDIGECRAFLLDACEALGVRPPPISLGRSNLANHSHYSGLRGIVLQRDMMDSKVILHELAHHAVRVGLPGPTDRRGQRQPSHGPLFVGVYAGLLDAFGLCPLDKSVALARTLGVDFDGEAAEAVASLATKSVGPNP